MSPLGCFALAFTSQSVMQEQGRFVGKSGRFAWTVSVPSAIAGGVDDEYAYLLTI